MLIKRDMVELLALSDQLRSGAWLRMSKAERCDLIRNFCRGYVVPPLSLIMPTTYRARLTQRDDLFRHIDQLLAPPAEKIIEPGRFNHPKEATLYLAGHAISAALETRAAIGDIVTVLACRLRPAASAIQIAPLAMTRLETTYRLGPISELWSQGALGYAPFVSALDERGLRDQWLLQDKVLGDIITLDPADADKHDLYDLTNGIRDHIFATYPRYDGVQYPGITVGLTSPNIALEPARWQDIEPLEVWVAAVTDELFQQPWGAARLSTTNLIKFGQIAANGDISYDDTNKTLHEAMNDFKQSYGRNRAIDGNTRPILQNAFKRVRISFGNLPDRRVYDLRVY